MAERNHEDGGGSPSAHEMNSQQHQNEVLLKQIAQLFDERINASETRLAKQLEYLERKMNAIETLPVPYGRPKRYYSATEYQSVSGAQIKKLGHFN